MPASPTVPAPSPALRRSAALGFLAAGLGAVAGAAWIASRSPVSPWFPVRALGLVAALAAVTLPGLAAHARDSLGPANAVTLARAALTAWVAAFVGEPAAEVWSLWLIAGSGLAFGLDAADGWVARRTGSASPFGALLDMELDALTILALCALAWGMDRAGGWILLSGALRYLFVAAGWAWPWMNRPLFPSERRRFVCGVQIVCLLGCLAPWGLPGFSSAWAAVGLAALVASFAADTAWLVARRGEPL